MHHELVELYEVVQNIISYTNLKYQFSQLLNFFQFNSGLLRHKN